MTSVTPASVAYVATQVRNLVYVVPISTELP